MSIDRGRPGCTPATPGISGDGRYLTFTTQDNTFVTPDANGFFEDAWLVDRATGEYILVSVNDAGEQGDNLTFAGDVSRRRPLRHDGVPGDQLRRSGEHPGERVRPGPPGGYDPLVSVATDGTEGTSPAGSRR